MQPYFYPIYPVPYWYGHHVPMVKYAENPSMWDRLTPYVPYLQAAGVGAGIGALGGAGIGAWREGDWKKALKSALLGMVAGAVAGSAVYGGYQMLFPANTTPVTPVLGTPYAGGAAPEAEKPRRLRLPPDVVLT